MSSPNFSGIPNSPVVLSGIEVHRQTADLAAIGVTGDTSVDESDEYVSPAPPIPINRKFSETTPLVAPTEHLPLPRVDHGALEGQTTQTKPRVLDFVLRPFQYIPAVFLGVLLNVLDGLSYGMIMFPIGDALFSSMAPAGLSMFYISTIISQLVYSLGGLAFLSGIGSEMIEVTPFFHSMALSVAAHMKRDAGISGDSELGGGVTPDLQLAILGTTIVTYAVSSIVTGLVFFALGKCRLGLLVGFFPRHILVGCIGGVGYFLLVTGVEVSLRIQGGIAYNLTTLQQLFSDYVTVLQWTTPIAATIVLVLLQRKISNLLLVPVYFIFIFAIFHVIVAVVPLFDLVKARNSGWIFKAVENNEPWYSHYGYLRFSEISWLAIAEQFPQMVALTFFGILHVPINVPALAVTVGKDEFDVDRELVAHGFSNAISGALGSVQNYLVYTNSVLFIRAGADDRSAGVLLAVATAGMMIAGPVVIGYIPVCVVGSLIYLLGYELLKEALHDTWGKLRKIEYTTICIIVVVMGAWDFVYGILAGVLLACLSFVVEAARRPVVRGVYTGVVARSTVLRHPNQQEFLKNVGNQICVVKLQGTLFFGSIGGVEKAIRAKFSSEKFRKNPIKFLIIDMKGVDLIDFSAAEGFRRILNLTTDFQTEFIISSVEEENEIVTALRDAGLFEDSTIHLFNTLNYALEWCENRFLQTYNTVQSHTLPARLIRKLSNPKNQAYSDLVFGTPRTTQVYKAATRTAKDEQRIQNRYYSNSDSKFKKKPLPLLMITFEGLSDKDERFWAKLAPYFIKEQIPENFAFYDTSKDKPSFFIVETGMIRSVCRFESDSRELHSSILPNTAFGDLFELSQYRSVTYSTVTETVAWRLSNDKVQQLLQTQDGQVVFNELLQVQTSLLKERFDSLTANLVLSA